MFASKIKQTLQHIKRYCSKPKDSELQEARRILAERDYYELYEERYRAASRSLTLDKSLIARSKALVRRDFNTFLRKDLLPQPPATLMDLGCGEGHNSIFCAGLGFQVTGVDISPTAVETAIRIAGELRVPAQFKVANVLNLSNFPDHCFDVAIDVGCLHMLVRLDHRKQYLNSVRRILRPGAKLFLFERVAYLNVIVEDEEEEIVRSVATVSQRTVGESCMTIRGCGFRNASRKQYVGELRSAGFHILRSHRIWSRFRPLWICVLATTETAKSAPVVGAGTSCTSRHVRIVR